MWSGTVLQHLVWQCPLVVALGIKLNRGFPKSVPQEFPDFPALVSLAAGDLTESKNIESILSFQIGFSHLYFPHKCHFSISEISICTFRSLRHLVVIHMFALCRDWTWCCVFSHPQELPNSFWCVISASWLTFCCCGWSNMYTSQSQFFASLDLTLIPQICAHREEAVTWAQNRTGDPGGVRWRPCHACHIIPTKSLSSQTHARGGKIIVK